MRPAWWSIAAVLIVAVAGQARADDPAAAPSYRAVIDRVELEPAAITGYRLRIALSALSLQGGMLDLTEPKSIKAFLGSRELAAPFALGRYRASGSTTAIAIVVQTTIDYSDVLPAIIESLDRNLLAALDDRTQVAVLGSGDTPGSGKLTAVKAARTVLAGLEHDGTASEPVLLDTLDRALLLLKKAGTPPGRTPRKVLLVIGDGRDRAGDRERVTRLGERAAKDGVRIHTVGYAPTDLRRPLLLLGELSKRSLGTFRWVVRGQADSWAPVFTQLRDEILDQYVLTYFVGEDDLVAGKKLKITTAGRTEVSSNEVKIPLPSCSGQPCETGYCVRGAQDRCVAVRDSAGRGVFGWILWIGAILMGVIVMLGVIGYVMTKRARS
jgi:hypothetical protein